MSLDATLAHLRRHVPRRSAQNELADEPDEEGAHSSHGAPLPPPKQLVLGGASSHYVDRPVQFPAPQPKLKMTPSDKLISETVMPESLFVQGSQKKLEEIKGEERGPERASGLLLFNYSDPSLPMDVVKSYPAKGKNRT